MNTREAKVRCPRCKCFRYPSGFINKKGRQLKTCQHCRTHVRNSRIRRKELAEKKKPVVLPEVLQTIIKQYAYEMCHHCDWSADYLVSVYNEESVGLCDLCASIYVDIVSCIEIYTIDDGVAVEHYPHTYGSVRASPKFNEQTDKILRYLFPQKEYSYRQPTV